MDHLKVGKQGETKLGGIDSGPLNLTVPSFHALLVSRLLLLQVNLFSAFSSIKTIVKEAGKLGVIELHLISYFEVGQFK